MTPCLPATLLLTIPEPSRIPEQVSSLSRGMVCIQACSSIARAVFLCRSCLHHKLQPAPACFLRDCQPAFARLVETQSRTLAASIATELTLTVAMKTTEPSRLAEISKSQFRESRRLLTPSTFVERSESREMKRRAETKSCASVWQKKNVGTAWRTSGSRIAVSGKQERARFLKC